MEPSSPESPSKKRKQPINGLRRDQPLFAGRRAPPSLQHPPEFFTDSLNTSYIPSPSPTKSPTRRDVRAKPRQTLGVARSTLASKSASRVNDENRPPSSSSSSDPKSVQAKLKPRPAQISPGAKTPSNKPARSPARNRTPTPPARGRQTSITSPANSESSPGRGYAEAYQRIVEEENLAHEDSIEDMEDQDDDSIRQDHSQDMDSSRLRSLQHSTSPISLRASRRASPRSTSGQIAEVTEDKGNLEHESGSESGPERTENITDTSLDSGSSQYTKDLQRLGALKNGAKAFSKARVGEKAGLTVENLQRRNGSNESLASAFSAGSLSNRGSDPSINVPKTWGRKARPGKDWLARINSKSGRFTGDVPKRHSTGSEMIAENQRREWSEPIDQWIATAADVPLPSSEDRLSRVSSSPQESTPRMDAPWRGSFDRRRQWELNEDEFTGRSLQISESPPIRIRNSNLDDIQEREIEKIKKKAVATNRLGELREKSSGESLRRTRSAQPIGDSQQDNLAASQSSIPRRLPSPPKQPANYQKTRQDETPEDCLHDDGEPIPDTPVVIYRNSSHDQTGSGKSNGQQPRIVRNNSRRRSHERQDSHDLLRRLARVTSESPSPTREHTNIERQPVSQKTDETDEQTPQIAQSSAKLKTPVVTGAWVDQTLEKTPQPPVPNTSSKTPLITGAWIDTPLPTGGRGPPMPTPSDQEEQKELHAGRVGAADLIHRLSPNNITSRPKLQSQVPLKYSGRPLAKSALEEILKDARSIDTRRVMNDAQDSGAEEDTSLHLGESTIQSLEELIANDEDFSTLLAPTPPSPQTSNPSSDPSPASQALTTSTATTNSSRLADLQSYTQLLSRLTTLAPSLRASRKGIETLERAVSTVPPATANTNHPNPVAGPDNPCHLAGSMHDFLVPCPNCSCSAHQIDPTELQHLRTLSLALTTITLPIPRLWYWPARSWRPRLTWLGVLTFSAYGCYLVEDYARFKFCHPLYARTMVGYGVDIDAPRPPFVAFKVVRRYARRAEILGPVMRALEAMFRVLGWIVGWLFGFVGGSGDETERVPANRDSRIPRPSWGPDLRLMDDEYL